jgi:uncharacterized protein
MKRILHRPENLSVAAFAHDAAELAGTRPLAEFDRLQSSTVSGPDEPIAWRARGESRAVRNGPPQVWLHLHGHGDVDLECQRCLEPVRQRLEAEQSFLFVEGEEAAEALDAQSEHDVLALSPRLDLFQLLEDELLLALPLIATHDDCTAALQPDAPDALPPDAAGATLDEPEPVHPFAALSALKREGSGH